MDEKGMNILETIVIEDTPEFMEVAKRAYSKSEGRSFHYFIDYEGAISYMSSGAKVDLVISDLFFPSKVNHRDGKIYGLDKDIPTEENPSGIGIAKYCMEKGIPYIIVSQGDRHQGDFAKARSGARGHPFKDEGIFQKAYGCDPLARMCAYEGSHVDKRQEKTWSDAMTGEDCEGNRSLLTGK